MKKENLPEKKYNTLIAIISIAVPLAVVALFSIRLKDFGINVTPLHFLPPIYAGINALTAIILILAVYAIKKGNKSLHAYLMKTAIGLSILFLLMYIAYHMTTDETEFGGEGTIRIVYFFLLITHIALSVITIPLVLTTYVRALAERFDKHKKIAKYTFPIWLYVAITGVIVYFMIAPYYAI